MKPAIPLVEAAREVEAVLAEAGFESVIIGGLAVFRWGEPRLTRDVDFTVLCPYGEEAAKVHAILSRLTGRIADAAEFAIRNRVLLASAANGIPVDIAFGGLPYEARVVERGSAFEFVAGANLRTCSAEDLVVMKAFAGRERDFLDLEGVIVRQGAALDWGLVEEELRPLLAVKGEPETWERLVVMRKAAG